MVENNTTAVDMIKTGVLDWQLAATLLSVCPSASCVHLVEQLSGSSALFYPNVTFNLLSFRLWKRKNIYIYFFARCRHTALASNSLLQCTCLVTVAKVTKASSCSEAELTGDSVLLPSPSAACGRGRVQAKRVGAGGMNEADG